MCGKECREDIHKTQTGTSCEKCNSKAFRLGILYFTDITISLMYILIYILAPKLSATASVAQWYRALV